MGTIDREDDECHDKRGFPFFFFLFKHRKPGQVCMRFEIIL